MDGCFRRSVRGHAVIVGSRRLEAICVTAEPASVLNRHRCWSDACEGGIDLARRVGIEDPTLQSHATRRRFHISQYHLVTPYTRGIDEHGHPSQAAHQLAQKLQPLCRQLVRKKVDPGQVAAGPGKARDETSSDWVVADVENDGNGRGCRLGRERRQVPPEGGDHCDAAANEVGHQRRKSIGLVVGPTVLYRDVLAFDVAKVLEPLAEGPHRFYVALGRLWVEETDHLHRCLLRPCRERPRHRAAEQRYELPSSHGSLSPRITPYHTVVGKPCCASPQNWLQMAEMVLRTALAARSLETIHFGSEYCR